jgi:hypothetical protein
VQQGVHEAGLRQIGIEGDGVSEGNQRRRLIAVAQGQAEIEMGHRLARQNFDGSAQQLDRLVEAARVAQDAAQVDEGVCVGRVAIEDAAVGGDSLVGPVEGDQGTAQIGQHIGLVWLDHQRPAECGLCLIRPVEGCEGLAHVGVDAGEAGAEFEGALVLFERRGWIA